jgi:hypothetical protein
VVRFHGTGPDFCIVRRVASQLSAKQLLVGSIPTRCSKIVHCWRNWSDALASKASVRTGVGVRIPCNAPKLMRVGKVVHGDIVTVSLTHRLFWGMATFLKNQKNGLRAGLVLMAAHLSSKQRVRVRISCSAPRFCSARILAVRDVANV